MGTTPTFSQTKPPAKLAIFTNTSFLRLHAKDNAAIETTVSPAPETSTIFLLCAF